MSELLPCPFCGGTNIRGGYIPDGWKFQCQDCGGCSRAYQPNSGIKAAERWNRRSVSSPDLLPPLTASIAIVADRDRYKRERDGLHKALDNALNVLVMDCVPVGGLSEARERIFEAQRLCRLALSSLKP